MLTIRQEQRDALDMDIRVRFVDRMTAHVRMYFPARFAELTEFLVREWILHGIERAASYRITSERDVCKYIDVMIVFGKDFDTSLDCAWAHPVLQAYPADASRKAELLLQLGRQRASTGAIPSEQGLRGG